MEKMRGKGWIQVVPGEMGHKRKIFHNGTISHWNKLLREVMHSPALDTQESAGQGARSSCLDHAFARKVGPEDP